MCKCSADFFWHTRVCFFLNWFDYSDTWIQSQTLRWKCGCTSGVSTGMFVLMTEDRYFLCTTTRRHMTANWWKDFLAHFWNRRERFLNVSWTFPNSLNLSKVRLGLWVLAVQRQHRALIKRVGWISRTAGLSFFGFLLFFLGFMAPCSQVCSVVCCKTNMLIINIMEWRVRRRLGRKPNELNHVPGSVQKSTKTIAG